MTKGMIFDIKEFAVYDGPGIRKTVFFKGCPLRCNWCHNPEGISFERELMVSYASCMHCHKCEEVCKHIECITCGDCIEACSLNLRKICGKEYEAKDLAKILAKGKDLLKKSGGGITISGGEPLSQPDFLFCLIDELKPMHIALDTSGYTRKDIFKRAVSHVDLVLFDIKHTDSKKHKMMTGVGNELILENLKYLCGRDTPFYARIPLIPGFNDTEENLEKTAELLKDAENLKGVDILPYNKTAGAKYEMVNKTYIPLFDSERNVEFKSEAFDRWGIKWRIR
jgi:pyruvate formate lyase activating enzyme